MGFILSFIQAQIFNQQKPNAFEARKFLFYINHNKKHAKKAL